MYKNSPMAPSTIKLKGFAMFPQGKKADLWGKKK